MPTGYDHDIYLMEKSKTESLTLIAMHLSQMTQQQKQIIHQLEVIATMLEFNINK